MRVSSGPLLVWLGTLSTLTLAEVDCYGDVEIASADDARELREACDFIEGDLTLAYSFTESINLDGLEYVEGSFKHEQCDWEMTPGNVCPKPPLLNISSSTLKGVGSLSLFGTGGLETLSFPNLRTVKKVLSLNRLDDLKHVDFTNLLHVDQLYWETKNLKTLTMNGLQSIGEGDYNDDTLWFKDVGELESVDAFFKNPVHPEYDSNAVVHLDVDWMPRVKHVTVGWEFIDELNIDVKELNVTLGGPDTIEMQIRSIGLGRGVINIERSSTLENLEVGTFNVNATGSSLGPNIEHLTLPFDHLGGLYLWGWDNLRSIELPQQYAENWPSLGVTIENCTNLNLSSENNAEGEKIWHWPKNGLSDLVIRGNMSNAFFDTFLEYNLSVSSLFILEDTSGNLDCNIFKNSAALGFDDIENHCSSKNLTKPAQDDSKHDESKDNKSSDDKSSDDKSNDDKSSDDKSNDDKSNDDKSNDDESQSQESNDNKTSDAAGLFSQGWRLRLGEAAFSGLILAITCW